MRHYVSHNVFEPEARDPEGQQSACCVMKKGAHLRQLGVLEVVLWSSHTNSKIASKHCEKRLRSTIDT